MAPIYERDAEVEALATAAHQALGGRGRLVVIEAAPGMGRTALLDDAARHASGAGLTVLRGRGRATEREFPFGVARQLFERTIAELDAPARERAFAGTARLAEPLFSDEPADAPLEEDAHFQLVHGLYWLVANLTNERPLLLAVDDVHLADHPSVSQLLYLAERIDGLRCALVITTAGGSTADRALSRLRSHPDARLLELEPLSLDTVGRIARDVYLPDAPEEVVAAVHRLSGGHPLFVHELISALDLEDAGDDPAAVERLAVSAPRSIAAAVARHVDDIGEHAHALVRAAAVLGDDAPASAAAEVARLSPDAVDRTALQLVRAGVLASPDPVRFATPLVEAAATSFISEPERRELHRRAGVALLRIGRPLTSVARHLQEAPPAGQPGVVSVLWAAARQARAAGEPETAVARLRRALAEPAPAEIRGDLLLDLGIAEALARDAGAIAHLEEAVATHRNRNQRARALLAAGRAVLAEGRGAQAAEILARGLEQHPSDSNVQLALEAVHLSATQLVTPLRSDAAQAARRAIGARARSDTGPGRSLLAHAALEHALRMEEPHAAREVLEDLVTRLAADHTFLEAGAAVAVAGGLTWLGEPAAADELATRYLAEARRRSAARAVAALSCRRALARWQCGDVTLVLADTELLHEDDPAAWGRYLVAGQAVRGMALIERGELPAAAAVLERPFDGMSWEDSALEPMILVARGRLALVLGRPADALQAFHRAGALAETAQISNPLAVPWRVGVAVAHAHLGDRDLARSIAEEEARRAEAAGLAVAHGAALRVMGLAAGGTGDLELLREAVAVLEGSPGRLVQVAATLDLAAAELSKRRSATAKDLLAAALGTAEACGALRLAERARSELERAGVRARPEGRGPGELTPGERRVVELAVEGLTNRAIAEQLFVSVKAVEWHLRNAYAKLGVANRRELATVMAT